MNNNENNSLDEQHEVHLDNETNEQQIFNEEMATEIMEPELETEEYSSENNSMDMDGTTWGWIAIALSIVSFFVMPFLFAAAGIIVGIVSRVRQAATLGYIAIGIGIVSLIIRFFMMPLF